MNLVTEKHIPLLLILITVFTGCEHPPPTSPERTFQVTLSIVIVDESGNPLKGMQVTTFPTTVERITDMNGLVVFEDIKSGDYQLIIKRHDVPIFFREVRLLPNKSLKIRYIIASAITINVHVTDISGEPLSGLGIYTSPVANYAVTDENGRAVFENMPIRRYTFMVKRENSTAYVYDKNVSIRDGKVMDIEIVIDTQLPFVKINSPANKSELNIYDIHFTGVGYDFEDGELFGSSLVWSSSIDGELGYGNELTVDQITRGRHRIYLTGIDSNQNTLMRSIDVYVFHYEKDSYFPAPFPSYWNYQYKNPNFIVINDEGKTEDWKLSDLQVSIDEENIRSCLLNYTYRVDGVKKTCRYYIVDYFEIDDDNISVTKTTEKLEIWEGSISLEEEPTERLYLEIDYYPWYTILKKQMDPMAEGSFETTVTGYVTWYYKYTGDTFILKEDDEYYETIEVETTVEVGNSETVETGIGTYEAVPLTIIQGDSVRKWWLAKGIGIVQIEYNTFKSPTITTLAHTNILTYAGINHSQKAAKNSFYPAGDNILMEINAPSNTPERMREVCEFLRGLCPR